MDKDVRRTDCGHPFYSGEDNPNVATLRRILLTYSMYNFDLGYCQVRARTRSTSTLHNWLFSPCNVGICRRFYLLVSLASVGDSTSWCHWQL